MVGLKQNGVYTDRMSAVLSRGTMLEFPIAHLIALAVLIGGDMLWGFSFEAGLEQNTARLARVLGGVALGGGGVLVMALTLQWLYLRTLELSFFAANALIPY